MQRHKKLSGDTWYIAERVNVEELWLTEEGKPMKVGGIQIMLMRLKERAVSNCQRQLPQIPAYFRNQLFEEG